MKRLLIFMAMLSLLVACSTVIPELEGSVTGTVMYKDQPLEGVEVVITPGGNSFVTKSDGTYTFENLTAETYTLTFKKKGYKTVTKNVKISAGLCVQVDVNLDIDGNLVTADTDILNFGKETKVMTFNIVNQLDKVVSWEISEDNIPEWASFKSLSGDIPSNSQNMVSVTVDRSKVKGEKDSFSMDIDLSTGNTLSVKVNVEAGKVGKVEPELYDIGYDYAVIQFTMMEDCVGFYAGVDNTSTRPSSDIKEYGVYYTDDENVIKFYCEQYPGQLHFLYVIPVNKYGQEGEMEVFEVPLKSEPEPEIVYTALKDIKSPGTYNVKDAVVVYADGNMCIIGDSNDALPFFYTYFDNTYSSAYPNEGDILTLSCEVISFHNVLEFLNPQFTVTGYKDTDDFEWTADISAFFDYSIKTAQDMTGYCASSDPGIRLVEGVRGNVVKSGKYYDLVVDGTSILGNLKAYDKARLSEYADKTVEVYGIAIGYNGVYMDILVEELEEVKKPTLESYLGYWNATVYNVDKQDWQTWENLYLESYVDEETGLVRVKFTNWLFGYPYYYFGTLGFYEESTGNIILEGNWSTGIYKYKDSDDNYRSYFTLLYDDGISDAYTRIYPSRSEAPTAVLEYKDEDMNSMILSGDEQYPDSNGNVANCFSFQVYNVTNDEYEGWYDVYRDIVFTRSSNPPAEATYSRSRSGKPRNCVEIDQVEAPRSFDARNFSGMTPKIL